MAKLTSRLRRSKETTGKVGLIKKLGLAIRKLAANVTRPLRNTKIWKFLRRTILRSPFGGYFVNSWQELKLVTWPKRNVAVRLTLVVVIFSVIFSVFTTALDYGFENLAKRVFLN